MKKLLVASNNQGKIKEIRATLDDFKLKILGLKEFPQIPEIKEDGNTFKENALKKARTGAEKTGLLTLADDSGLVVDYLNGKPGIYSARFAGADATDADNNQKLLKQLKGVPSQKRTAHFKCVMALVDPKKEKEFTKTGTCNGVITNEPRGDQGFGYDPLFLLPGYEKTMAELPAEVKNKISHRAHALEKIKEVFNKLF